MQITAWGAWPSARTLLLNDAPMSMLTVSIPAARSDPSWSKNASRVGSVLALSAPHDLLGGVVGDQGEVVMVAFPAHLVDPDADQPVEPGGVEPVGDHPGADPAHGVPVDPGEPGDRGLVGLGRQERHQVLASRG